MQAVNKILMQLYLFDYADKLHWQAAYLQWPETNIILASSSPVLLYLPQMFTRIVHFNVVRV